MCISDSIYNEAECSLRITASGELSLTNHNLTDSRFLAPSTAPETLTEYAKTLISELQKNTSVSYTHLDVYKRQI